MTCIRPAAAWAGWLWTRHAPAAHRGDPARRPRLGRGFRAGPGPHLRRRPHPRLRAERALAALRPGTRLPGAGPADVGPQPPDRTGRHGQRGPAEDLVVTGPGGGRPVNLISSVCVSPKDPLNAGKMVNVMVRRFR